MKYYSEFTKEMYNNVEDLIKAEEAKKTMNKEAEEKKAAREEINKLENELIEKIKEYDKKYKSDYLNDRFNEEVKKFVNGFNI